MWLSATELDDDDDDDASVVDNDDNDDDNASDVRIAYKTPAIRH